MATILRMMFWVLLISFSTPTQSQTTPWDGTTKYTTLVAAGITGSGTEVDPYILDNANKFVAFGTLANNSTAYWQLTTNIDLGGNEWPYSGSATKTFKGHFDGGNHTVSNYTLTPITNKANGLFGTVQGSSATVRADIKNLKIADVTIATDATLGSTTYIGALVGNVAQYADLLNVQVIDGSDGDDKSVTITLQNVNGNCHIGALAGALQKNSALENCTVEKPVIDIQGSGTVGGNSNIGGAIGNFTGSSASEITKIDKPTSGSENGLTVTSPTVTINKIASSWYIGCAIGRIQNYSDVNYVTVSNPTLTYNAVGSPNNELYLGTFAGHIQGNVGSETATPVATNVKHVRITGDSEITIGTGTENISKVKAGAVGQIANYSFLDDWSIDNVNIQVKGSVPNVSNIYCYFGGCIGQVSSVSTAANVTVSTTVDNITIANCTINVIGDIYKEVDAGGAFGRIEGNVGDASKDPQRTYVRNVTLTGTSLITLGTDANSIVSAKAGAAGYLVNNAEVSGWSINNSEIIVKGNLVTSASYLGGGIGHVTSNNTAAIDKNIGTTVDDITLANSTVTVTGNIEKDAYLGGAFGYIAGTSGDATKTPAQIPQLTTVSNVNITGTSQLNICTNGSNNINYVRTGVAGMVTTNVTADDWTIANINIQVNGNLISTSSSIGGCIGNANSKTNGPVDLSNMSITGSSVIGINANVDRETYIGGAFGRMDAPSSTHTHPVKATNVSVVGLDISFDGNFTQNVYAGGVVGYLYTMNLNNSEPTQIVRGSASGKIYSKNSHTFMQDKTYAFGGVVGITNQSATNQSRIEQCVSEVDFDLSGYTPATSSGSTYNIYKSGFVVGGVIGRMDNPSLLPEHLYYTGKIYAPFAAVGPIVGVFQTNIGNAAYIYNDYSGENAANVTPEEWKKVNTWYYSNYKLGLSPQLLSQSERTKNYTTAPIVEDGVSYLLVDNSTFTRQNEISGTAKKSYTVLAYTASGSNANYGIFPAWNQNVSTYLAYYMYYMQGFNAGTYTDIEEKDFFQQLIDKKIIFIPSIQHTGDDDQGYEFTISVGDLEDDAEFTLTYQWYESDKTTPISGATSNTLNISRSDLDGVGGKVYCVVTVSGTGFSDVSRTLLGVPYIVVFVNGNNYIGNGANPGNDNNDGMTPQSPVKTIDKANSLLDGKPWDKNIIVVMGDLKNDGDFLQSHGRNPATITGKWDGIDYEGVVRFRKTLSEDGVNPGDGPGKTALHNYVSADTKFEFLTLDCKNTGSGGSIDNCFFECHGHDVWFGKGIKMKGFRRLSAAHGNLDENDVTPELSIILSATNLAPANVEEYWTRLKPQTLTIESGHYGRILGGRYTGNFFSNPANTSHSIQATAQHPSWAVINIDIDPNNEMTGIEYVSGAAAADNPVTYTNDVHCIVAGLTDGTIFGDYQINLHGGKVGYIVGANQGNCIVNGSKTFTPIGSTTSKNFGQWPNSSFYGRTVINVEQLEGLKDVQVANLYAGGLGRDAGSNNTAIPVDMYVYGHTEINVKSGTVLGDIFGGGAGGVIGLGLWDEHVPYATTAENNPSSAIYQGVEYARTGTKQSPLANVTLRNPDGQGGYTEEILNLGDSYTTINVSGGTIGGSVYGGGDGFVSNMEVSKKITMQGVGSVFGTSNVNITGGTIMGSVYGGSKGSDKYFGMVNAYGQTVTHIAEMNGTINLTITGTEDHYPTINGDIYGAGAGVSSSATQEYLRIATAGNTDLGDNYKTNINILVDLPDSHPFEGSIYGGGQMGAVDGDIKVKIRGGVIQGNVYGAGNGEDGHPDKAKVTGNPEVLIGQGIAFPIVIQGSVYGGGHAAAVEGSTQVTLDGPANKSVTVEGHMFGGGHGESAVIKTSTSDEAAGNTQVLLKGNVTVGKFQNGHCISGGNVYGGGYGGTVEGNTRVIIGED